MAFVDFYDIEKLIPEAIIKIISPADKFDYFNNLASQIVADTTGLTIPEDNSNTPQWLFVPIAYIITKLASAQVIGLKQETIDRIDNDFKHALNNLRQHVNKGMTSSLVIGKNSEIEGIYKW